MKAIKGSAGTVISFTNVRLKPSKASSALSDTDKQLQLFAQAALPPYVVKESGEFDRLEDAAAFKVAYLRFFKQVLPAMYEVPQLRQLLEQVTSEDFLTAAVGGEWNQNVGFWVDATLDMGETYSSEYEGSVPLLPGRTIKMQSKFRVIKEVPCTRTGQARKCVELEMRTTPDQADMAAAIDSFSRQFALPSPGKGEVMESIDVEENIRLVTETDGLIPHQITTYKRVVASIRSGDERKSMSEVQESSVSYTYRSNAP
ncbi:hypothetical protein [Ramlibacter tataouinensis]|uniref:Uncharacterized protein n=1 Tax=Ramlibacter tataouinensis TaxID=94132 RepID=A0A127JRK3_9BURK|nr:hypothetical protein [Ramlibacter tataouinensis]AMO22545.1 hypothetical protein UC35_06160 [Ramlibacter tataouinensis]